MLNQSINVSLTKS